jgi:hypothetical protein
VRRSIAADALMACTCAGCNAPAGVTCPRLREPHRNRGVLPHRSIAASPMRSRSWIAKVDPGWLEIAFDARDTHE